MCHIGVYVDGRYACVILGCMFTSSCITINYLTFCMCMISSYCSIYV